MPEGLRDLIFVVIGGVVFVGVCYLALQSSLAKQEDKRQQRKQAGWETKKRRNRERRSR